MAQSGKVALVDMDGTLVDYVGQLERDLAALAAPGEKPVSMARLWDEGVSDHLQRRMDIIKQQAGWWRELPDLTFGHHVLHWLREIGFDIHILTKGPYRTTSAWTEKVEWCRARLSPDAKVTITEDKSLVYGRVLVDDYPDYMTAWLEWRPRGLGIMPKSETNKDFRHERVVIYDGTNAAEVRAALQAAFDREAGE